MSAICCSTTLYGELSRKYRYQRTRRQPDCHEQIGNARMERPWFRGRAENRWPGSSQSQKHMPCRTYHPRRCLLVRPPRSLPRTGRQSTPPLRRPTCSFPSLLRQAVFIEDICRRITVMIGKPAGEDVSLPDDINDITERQCKKRRFPQHFSRVINFT